MSTKCAPSYANIFMGWFEEKFIFAIVTNLSDFYLCFIDDIFLIWNGTKTNKETDISSKANQEQKDSVFITQNSQKNAFMMSLHQTDQKSILKPPQEIKIRSFLTSGIKSRTIAQSNL